MHTAVVLETCPKPHVLELPISVITTFALFGDCLKVYPSHCYGKALALNIEEMLSCMHSAHGFSFFCFSEYPLSAEALLCLKISSESCHNRVAIFCSQP